MTDEYIEVTVAVPIKLFVKKTCVGHFLGPIYHYSSTFGIGSISKIRTCGNSPKEAAHRMADRLQGVLSA